jgi:hypothetical protein
MVANRSVLTEKATAQTAMPVIVLLPTFHQAPVRVEAARPVWRSVSLSPAPQPLFLLFQSLLI